MSQTLAELEAATLPQGIGSRVVADVNGLQMRILEAGDTTDPCVVLLHGFPELAFSWRKIMLPLARAGFYVVAPDQRGYGMTRGSDNRYDGDVASFRQFNLARDVLGLVYALGRDHVHAVIGHDFGSPVAAACGVIRPDVFRRVGLMSAPFAGMPALRQPPRGGVAGIDHRALLALPEPRQHYQWYYSGRQANDDMIDCAAGLHDFLRAYYHYKSADWAGNQPHPLADWSAHSLAQLPSYYVMHADVGMAETVAPFMPAATEIANCSWLPDRELAVYTQSFRDTGLQGGLNWYRCVTSGEHTAEMQMFADLPIRVPSVFIAGASDWGIHQKPGEFEQMQHSACSDLRQVLLIPGAGHWVQQEQPSAVVDGLLNHLLS